MQKPNIKESFKASVKNLGNAHTKKGAYSLGMIAFVIAIVIVANLILGQLPSSALQYDISSNNIYEISDTSRDMLKNLDKKIEILVFAEESTIDDRINTFITKYASLSDKISVEHIDPVLHPATLTEYETTANNIVVKASDSGRRKVIPFDSILISDPYASYYGGSTDPTEFDGEGQLTAAVSYVLNDAQKKLYQCTDHGEGTFSDSVQDLLGKASISINNLELLTAGDVPEDCDLLVFYGPKTDIADSEQKALQAYMAKGGKLLIILNEEAADEQKNLHALLTTYGLQVNQGYVADMQRNYQGNYYSIFPEITGLNDGLATDLVLIPNSLGMTEVAPARDTITETSFMVTSENSYLVTDNDQKQGTYVIGAYATEPVEGAESTSGEAAGGASGENTSRLTVFSGKNMLDEQITGLSSSLQNLTLFMNAVNANFADGTSISISPKSLQVSYNTVQNPGIFSLLCVIGIPLIVLIAGFVVWFKRRKA